MSPTPGRFEGRVCDILEPDGVDDFGDEKDRKDPQSGEGDRQSGAEKIKLEDNEEGEQSSGHSARLPSVGPKLFS